MRMSFHLVVVIVCALFVASSGVTRAAEKKIYSGGVWYNQARDGSLSVCQECNAGREVSTVSVAPISADVPTCYPCQMMRPQFSPAKSISGESCPCVSAQSDGRLQLGIGSGSCSAGVVRGLFSRRPIRSLFGRLFGGGCGG
jgi:hypothetical protein